MKLSKLIIPVAAAALLALGGAASAQSKKIVNTSSGSGAPMNFPTPMTDVNGDYNSNQGGAADGARSKPVNTSSGAGAPMNFPSPSPAATSPTTKTKVTKHHRKASNNS